MFGINKASIVSVVIIIGIGFSGAAFGIHYVTENHNLEVLITPTNQTAIEGKMIHLRSEVIGKKSTFYYSWVVNSTFYSSKRYLNLTFYSPGINVISLTVSSKSGYYGSDMIIMNVYSSPNVFIYSSKNILTTGQNDRFNSNIVGGIGPYYYTWFVNGQPEISGFNKSEITYRFNSNGSYNIGLEVNNSKGFFGSTEYNFDPWGFSENTNVVVRSGYGQSNGMANVQTQNASGILTFHFYLYNPLVSDSSDNITVNLYNSLPSNGPSSPPTKNLTLYSGIIKGRNGTWVSVTPSIHWNYTSIVVIPQIQTGLNGDEIGVANPGKFNNIFSHYWFQGWDSSDDGFAGYWTISHNITLSVG